MENILGKLVARKLVKREYSKVVTAKHTGGLMVIKKNRLTLLLTQLEQPLRFIGFKRVKVSEIVAFN